MLDNATHGRVIQIKVKRPWAVLWQLTRQLIFCSTSERVVVMKPKLFLLLLPGLALVESATSSSVEEAATLYYNVPVITQKNDYSLDQGSPEIDSMGYAFLRNGAKLITISPAGSLRSLDINLLAANAINRDIFRGKEEWDGKWDSSPLVDTAVVVDDVGRIYTLITPRYSNLKTAVLLWSVDRGNSWHALQLTGRDAMIETRDGFNDNSGPPTVISFDSYGAYNGLHLWLEPLVIKDNAVVRAAPAGLVSNQSIISAKHSGCSNSTFTIRDKIFIVYPVTGAAGRGTAEFGRQYNRLNHQFEGDEIPLGRSLTIKGPDLHDEPGITSDKRGVLTVIMPGHQVMLQMIRSRVSWSMLGGWSRPELIGQPRKANAFGFYTYPSLTTSPDGTINVIARAEGTHGLDQLVQFQRRPAAGWTIWPNGTVERPIAIPKRTNYVAWRQRMTMSPAGALYLNFRYFPDELLPNEIAQFGLSGVKPVSCSANGRCWFKDSPHLAPMTITSTDGGTTWHHG